MEIKTRSNAGGDFLIPDNQHMSDDKKQEENIYTANSEADEAYEEESYFNKIKYFFGILLQIVRPLHVAIFIYCYSNLEFFYPSIFPAPPSSARLLCYGGLMCIIGVRVFRNHFIPLRVDFNQENENKLESLLKFEQLRASAFVQFLICASALFNMYMLINFPCFMNKQGLFLNKDMDLCYVGVAQILCLFLYISFFFSIVNMFVLSSMAILFYIFVLTIVGFCDICKHPFEFIFSFLLGLGIEFGPLLMSFAGAYNNGQMAIFLFVFGPFYLIFPYLGFFHRGSGKRTREFVDEMFEKYFFSLPGCINAAFDAICRSLFFNQRDYTSHWRHINIDSEKGMISLYASMFAVIEFFETVFLTLTTLNFYFENSFNYENNFLLSLIMGLFFGALSAQHELHKFYPSRHRARQSYFLGFLLSVFRAFLFVGAFVEFFHGNIGAGASNNIIQGVSLLMGGVAFGAEFAYFSMKTERFSVFIESIFQALTAGAVVTMALKGGYFEEEPFWIYMLSIPYACVAVALEFYKTFVGHLRKVAYNREVTGTADFCCVESPQNAPVCLGEKRKLKWPKFMVIASNPSSFFKGCYDKILNGTTDNPNCHCEPSQSAYSPVSAVSSAP